MKLKVQGIPTEEFDRLRAGGIDANGQVAVRRVGDGSPSPCRHCIGLIGEGEDKLILGYRPFGGVHPYAEVGPIFLHGRDCPRYEDEALPAWFEFMDPAIVRGYGEDDWIRYDTGSVVRGPRIGETCRAILADPTVAYVHVRSKFNCFQCRVDRG